MPITIKHDTGAGLIGAYGAGQSSARRRQQKYAMDQLLLQQRHRQRMQEIGLRGGIRGRAAGQQIIGWNDPLDRWDLTPVVQAAARRARARKERLAARGKNYTGSSFGRVPAYSIRTPITQDDLDRQREWEDWQRRKQAEWTREDKLRSQQERRMARVARVAHLTEIPDHLATTDPDRHRSLSRQRSAIQRMVHDPRTDWDAPDGSAQEKLEKAIEEYETTIGDLPERDLNKGGVVLDPAVGYRPTQPGETPTHWDMGPGQPPVPTDDYKAQQEAKQAESEAQAKEEEERAAKEEAKQKAYDDYVKAQYAFHLERMRDPMNKDRDKPKTRAEAKRMAMEDADELYTPFTQPGIPDQRPRRRPAAPQEPPTQPGEQPRRPIAPPGTVTGRGPAPWGSDPGPLEGIARPGTVAGRGPAPWDPDASPLAPGEAVRLLGDTEPAPPPPTPEQIEQSQLPQVKSDADYKKLKPGTVFIDPETGRRYRKPYQRRRPTTAEKTLSAMDAIMGI